MTRRAQLGAFCGIKAVLLGTIIALSTVRVNALNPALDVSQYAHTAWSGRDGFSLGNIYSIAQAPDGYLLLGSEFGFFRFDGVRTTRWELPSGQHLPANGVNDILVARDGSLWIETYDGFVTWGGGKLIRHPEFDRLWVVSLLEDHEGTVWAGTLGNPGRLCALRSGSTQCFGEDGAFGRGVMSLYEDSSGTLWAGTETGLWRWKPGPPKRFATPMGINAISSGDGGRPLIALEEAGLLQFVGDKIVSYPIRDATNSHRLLRQRDVDSNKLLRDREGGLWIGTVEHGLIHVHQGRTDVFTRADGLSGDVVLNLFEDREGSVWVSTTGGLDRFRELPVTTISVKQGLSSDATQSVLAALDGSTWVATHDGLTRLQNGRSTIFRTGSGLPDNDVQSLFQDHRGQIWVSTRHGLAYFQNGRFLSINSLRNEKGQWLHFITGDDAGNLWLSEQESLLQLQDARLVKQTPWSKLAHQQSAEILLPDHGKGGLWLGFWQGGGVSYFKDGQLQVSYTTADGLGKGHVPDLQLDQDGTLWAATEGGLSRIKDNHIATLTTSNGLPCDTIHWAREDHDRSFWMYTACGLVHIAHEELDAWIANPEHKVATTLWDAADGVRLRSVAATAYGPRVTESTDGKLWFVTGEGVQVFDPHHLTRNQVPPPVCIEKIIADGKIQWQNSAGTSISNVTLPSRTRDIQIEFTALSLIAPEKVRFKYKLEGQDQDWKEVTNLRHAEYTNLMPRTYRFRLIASNNSGVWNEQGDVLEFSIAPAYYQTNWFRALCAAIFLALLWVAYRFRIRQLEEQEKKFREAIESIPALAFVARSDGYRTFFNQGWVDYTGFSSEQSSGSGWQTAVHPDDLKRVLDKWRTSIAIGEPFDYETRLRRGADGAYRWFLVRVAPVHDKRGNAEKWCGVAADIEDRKHAEQLQAELAHVNRTSILGELMASISHEVKQPITATMANARASLRWLKRDKPEVEEACQTIDKILRDGVRATEIIDRLRALYKKTPPKRELVSINEVIGEMVALLRGEANRYGVSIRMDLGADLPKTMADRVQLQQVLMNLMLNGIEAMKETGGILTVKSQTEDRQVLISVSDTGVGLPAENMDRIFDAFFTTKPQGSGMGLAISRSIIESHGGRLSATANTGRGASFHFSLPTEIRVPETSGTHPESGPGRR